MIGVIVHMEALSFSLRLTRTGSQLGFRAVGMSAAKQIFFQSASVLGVNRCGRRGAGRAARARRPERAQTLSNA